MFVYILRHAIAVERGRIAYPHDDRPLTQDGREKMTKAAKGIANLVDEIDVILTSPLIRAHDTARIVSLALGTGQRLEVCKDLEPGSSLKSLFSHLSKYKGVSSMMVVGHEPDLGYLASALLGSDEPIIEFKKGGLCAIEVSTLSLRVKGKLIWHMQPKHLRALA